MTHDCVQKYIIFFTVFACILHYFYLVDDIYNTIPIFRYQYFIIYNVWYEYPIYPRISDIQYQKSLFDTIPKSVI